jgi:hypothetical protein
LVLGLVSNQCMANSINLGAHWNLNLELEIILPPKLGPHICLVDKVGFLAPIPN